MISDSAARLLCVAASCSLPACFALPILPTVRALVSALALLYATAIRIARVGVGVGVGVTVLHGLGQPLQLCLVLRKVLLLLHLRVLLRFSHLCVVSRLRRKGSRLCNAYKMGTQHELGVQNEIKQTKDDTQQKNS